MSINTNPAKYLYCMIDIFDIEPVEDLILAKDDNEVIEYYTINKDRYGDNVKFFLYFDVERAKNDYLIGEKNTEHYKYEYNSEVRYMVKKISVSDLNNLDSMNIYEFFDFNLQFHNS